MKKKWFLLWKKYFLNYLCTAAIAMAPERAPPIPSPAQLQDPAPFVSAQHGHNKSICNYYVRAYRRAG